MHTLNSPQPTLNTPFHASPPELRAYLCNPRFKSTTTQRPRRGSHSTHSPSNFYDPRVPNVFMILLSFIVIVSTGGVLFWFFRRLRRIEDEVWGSKRAEAAQTARAVAEEEDEVKTHADDATEP